MNKKPWLSFLLSVLKPGLGQMYNGELKKGIILTVCVSILNVIFLAFVSFYSESKILNIIAILSGVLMTLGVAAEAFIYSLKHGLNFQAQKYNRWYFYIAFFIIVTYGFDLPVALFTQSKIAHAYKVPTSTMENTVLVGDYLLANHLSYTGKQKPKINDIVIFKYFGIEKKDYIKRIVASSGQKVKIVGKNLFVNETLQKDIAGVQYIRNGEIHNFPDTFEVDIPYPNQVIKVEGLNFREMLFLYHIAKQENKEVEANITLHGIGNERVPLDKVDNWYFFENLKKHIESSLDSTKITNSLKVNGEEVSEYKVKNENYFVLGDNRDNSLDSRFYGFVNANSIKGKAKFIYMSIDPRESIRNLNKWIRWKRIGNVYR